MAERKPDPKEGLLAHLKQWLGEKLDPKTVGSYLTLTGFLYGPLDERLKFRDALRKALKRPLPEHVRFYHCFGGLAFILFVIEVVTGILLAVYYRPSPDQAYASVQYTMNEVLLGWIVRGLHQWAAVLLLLMVLLHMMRVFFTGAYRRPREFNWILGVLLLACTVLFAYTGQLLAWDQAAYWRTAAGAEIIQRLPLLGDALGAILLGGHEVSGSTLSRFYWIHVLMLPWCMAFLMFAHFAMVRKQGIAEPL